MRNQPITTKNLTFHPLTPNRWEDFTNLFSPNGAHSGCWCIYWHITRSEFGKNGGEGNKQAMKALVDSGKIPGIIGYQENQPVTWCSIAPREEFGSLERSRNLRRIDDQPVWSIVCFFINRKNRHAGLLQEVIQAAITYTSQNGAKIVEAYPVEVKKHQSPGNLYMGILDIFLRAGFEEIETRGAHRIVRYSIN